jgi:hypothetical protein
VVFAYRTNLDELTLDQALLGRESFGTTQRYAHLAPDAHNKVKESWERRASREEN